MMSKDTLPYFQLARTWLSGGTEGAVKIPCAIITNFTDDALIKLFTGVCFSEHIYPTIIAPAYKQYHFDLKNPASILHTTPSAATFIFFEFNTYRKSEFADPEHFTDVLQDIDRYAKQTSGIIVLHTFLLPHRSAYGNLFSLNPLYTRIQEYNKRVEEMAATHANIHLIDTNAIATRVGETHVWDMRGMYAFHTPFTHEFLLEISLEWISYLRIKQGKVRKCLVLDLDNTLWGGVVGEVGAHGIQLGPEYPGLAFQSFQQALLEYYNRGVLLAINSKNNYDDVREVFETNPHMLLKENHFAATRINWENKVQNMLSLAEELNVGIDSFVFLDDDPMQRDNVKQALPEVLVPDFSVPPESYTHVLHSLAAFNQLQLTDEDKEKSRMYSEETERKKVHVSAKSLEEYVANLNIQITMRLNDRTQIPRLSQLTLKTNQFNVTTRRYTEKDIEDFMDTGFVFSGDIIDRFGDYGITVLAIVQEAGKSAILDTFLMSCRVLGRGVETAFLDTIIRFLAEKEVKELGAEFIPTKKNFPAEKFFGEFGFSVVSENEDGVKKYSFDILAYIQKSEVNKHSIDVSFSL